MCSPALATALPTSTVGSGCEATNTVLGELSQTRTFTLDCFFAVMVMFVVAVAVVLIS